MTSLNASSINKPLDPMTSDSLKHHESGEAADPEHVARALHTVVEASAEHRGDVQKTIHAPVHKIPQIPFVSKLIPGLENLANQYHVGNFVEVRGTGERFFESMPLYPRLGMHLLFYGSSQIEFLHNATVEKTLKQLSIRQGKIYDDPESVESIPSFMETYSIQTDELLEPDISRYKTFNEFFYRRLKSDARPVQNADDIPGFCSAADCRLTVYGTVDLAKKFWVKGNNFTIPNLLGVAPSSQEAQVFENGSLAIFRLAPADYHRFHCPLDGFVSGVPVDIPGQYYTVNPQAVNESGFNVFTDNKRSVLTLTHGATGKPVAFVAIGAMLVGSIVWTCQPGQQVKKGDELGYFAYGGSTVICVFPPGMITFDQDLVKTSEQSLETLVKVGYSLGTCTQA